MNAKNLMLTILSTLALAVLISQGYTAEPDVEGQLADQADSAVVVVDKIDINQADPVELIRLPGIGKSTAAKITAYRDANGPFKSVEELLNVKGIGPDKLEKIKPLVTLS